MKVVCRDKVINLDKFDSIQCRASLIGDGCPVEAIRHVMGCGMVFGGVTTVTEEIARFKHESVAVALLKAIKDSWAANEEAFDVEKWIVEEAPKYISASEPNTHLLKISESLKGIKNSQHQQEKVLNQIAECLK